MIPTTLFCDGRTFGGGGKVVTWVDECALWQSAQVEWRFCFGSALSLASCTLLPVVNGCPIFANSTNTFAAAGDTFAPPLWHAMHACSFAPRSSRAAPGALCDWWHALHEFCPTVG